ncbi:hypothetical protein NM688_g4209 [Phlebia brevispora]|uniref:Uncharacterized protein n=1 Tax=Phlebia brevispora TaxID=194682 RepID=A0ACC1T3J2_9APHY|nr:hypothetical protein NM688_g4209 [Phlebia brevispora]
MPSKRTRIYRDESDTEAESSQAPKRARTSDESEVEVEQPVEAPEELTEHVEEHGSDLEDNEEFEEPELPNEDEEKRFEEEHGAEVLARVQAVKGQGSVAELGIIERIEMAQFMCHKFLEFNFGPQINFIIGHNGSGKSAVLSALTVALGGKANVTGRGAGLKSFIREGQAVSEVTVTIKNQGEDAYKRKEYGDSIVITRRFTKDGGSSYRIKSKSGRTISTKREELSAICDHMNIQVDNPMNILTQDAARQFLSASSSAEKYKFFLRGTQLSQLSDEYSTCLENISQTQRILKSKTEVLPDLVQAYKDAVSRYAEASKAREMVHRIEELRGELAWAHVAGKEKACYMFNVGTSYIEQYRTGTSREARGEAEEKLHAAEDLIQTRESEQDQLGDVEHLNQRLKELKEKIRENKEAMHRTETSGQSIKPSKMRNIQIDEYTRKIAAEEQKRKEDTQSKQLETKRKLEEAQEEFNGLQERQKALNEELQDVNDRIRKADIELKNGQRVGEQLREEIEGAQNQLRHIAELEKSKLAPFGTNMERVLQEINNTNWHGERPVGPLGLYVKVRDPHKWANVMRVMIGSAMSAFAVSDARDRRTLDTILKRHGNRPNIIIAPVDMFDYSRGEPPEDYLTVLRALDISNPYVLRVLINSNNIERTLLASTRADGDNMLVRLGGGGVAWTADFFSVRRFPEGGGQSNLLPSLNRRGGDSRMQLFTTDDASAQRRRWEETLRDAEKRYRDKGEDVKQAKIALAGCGKRKKEIEAELHQLSQRGRVLQSRIDGLKEELDQGQPVEIQVLMSALQVAEDEKNGAFAQFAEIEERRLKLNNVQRPLLEEEAKVKKAIRDFGAVKEDAVAQMQQAVQQRLQAQSDKQHWEKKLAEEEAKVAEAKDQAETLEVEFQNWTEQAAKICKEKFENPRNADLVKRNLDSSQKALEMQRKKNPIPVEELARLVKDKKEDLDKVQNDLKLMVSLNKSLRKSIKTRLTRWHEFRRHIALRCKIYFSYHLSQRGYFGKVIFDHVAGSLQLKVQTDDLASSQAVNSEKDPRSLSGGEKSFSTICLLLSLWESIGCPIRCLDEFDVFMDAVNRRISMRMMIDTANASDRKQYILITPQDMNNVHITPTVRVHRMPDPERGQGVLRFAGGNSN